MLLYSGLNRGETDLLEKEEILLLFFLIATCFNAVLFSLLYVCSSTQFVAISARYTVARESLIEGEAFHGVKATSDMTLNTDNTGTF